MLGDGVVVHHGVHVAAADKEAQTGSAEDVNGLGISPVRLGDDDDAVAVAFQNPADDGVAEGMVVHISVADDIDEVTLLPAPFQHLLFVNRQK